MARNPRSRVEARFSHSAVRGYASRGRGKAWHLILKGPTIPSTATANGRGPYPWPRHVAPCGANVETLAQLEAAVAHPEPFLCPPTLVDLPTVFCRCCCAATAERLSKVWVKAAVAAGDWRLAAADMLNMLERLDTVYLGAGELAPLR